jgi:4-hydroxy-tetrahydrodipicolinate reductase
MKIGITGINGRMGKTLVKAVSENEFTELTFGLVRNGSSLIGKDVGEIVGLDKNGILASDDLEKMFLACDAIIDFSSPELTLECAKLAAKYNKILISGTTGITENQKQQLAGFAASCVIIWSSNMSIGVNLLINLSEKVAKILHNDYDAEIFEMHHHNKVDAPSGTALSLGEAIAKGRGLNFGEVCRKTRDGIVGKREKNEIGFSSLRGGDVIGDHTVIFAGIGERVELSHKASNRDIYARGSIRAAIWGSGKRSNQESGFYSMRDVLGEIV